MTLPQVVKAWVELRNTEKKKENEIIMNKLEQNGQVWWVGEGNITLDTYKKLGIWEIIACANVKKGDKEEVVREVQKQLLIQSQVSGIALGFRVWRDNQQVTQEEERRYPYSGDKVLFRAFLRIIFRIGVVNEKINEKVSWYSSEEVNSEQLKFYSWIVGCIWDDKGNITWDIVPQKEVSEIPEWLKKLFGIKVTWRRFQNVVHRVNCGGGQARWYGMRYSDIAENFFYQWEAEEGTSWWGAKIEWQAHKKMIFLYPTPLKNQKRGLHLITGEQLSDNTTFNRGYKGQLIWTPDPWKGRLSVRRRWTEEINFDPNDPFFQNYREGEERDQAIRRQRELHQRILEWAYSFLYVPYSWDGRSYGGKQSTNKKEHTCSGHNVGDRGRGYGIDCSEFVSLVAEKAGIPNSLGYTGALANTDLARTIVNPNANIQDGISDEEKGWIYVRPGDFLVKAGYQAHVVYVRENPILDEKGRPIRVPTIEASSTDDRVTDRRERTNREEVPISDYLPRRWIAR